MITFTRTQLLFLIVLPFLIACSNRNSEFTDLGTIRMETSTKNEQADYHFKRGLAALHSFWYSEAKKEFNRAIEFDKDYAMAYWGIAMSNNQTLWQGQDLEASRSAMTHIKLNNLMATATEMEKALISSLDVLFDSKNEDKLSRDRNFRKYMRSVYGQFKDEEEAQALYALSILGTIRGGMELTKDKMESASLMQDLMQKNPNHPGAAHYLIHSVDDPVHAYLGLEAANIYAKIAPASSHALHMPSHIYVQLGMWNSSIESNIDAYRAGVERVRNDKSLGLQNRDNHSLEWLIYSLEQQGRYREAKQCLDSITRDRSLTESQSVDNYFKMSHSRYVLETRKWDRIDFPETYEKTGYASHVEVSRLGTLVISHLKLGREEMIQETFDRLEEIIEMNESEDKTYLLLLSKIVKNQMLAMKAWFNEDQENALTYASIAADLEAGRPSPNGPNIILKPAHEFYGELLMEYGEYRKAIRQFNISLSRIPNKSLTLLNMARTHVALDETMEASFYYTRLMENWEKADNDIDGFKEAVDFLEKNPFSGELIADGTLTNNDLRNFISYQFSICDKPLAVE